MLGFGGWPLCSGPDLLLHVEQEVFGALSPWPHPPELENEEPIQPAEESQPLGSPRTTRP